MQVYYNKLGSEGSNLPQGIELRKGVEMLRIWAPSYEDETEFSGREIWVSLFLSLNLLKIMKYK